MRVRTVPQSEPLVPHTGRRLHPLLRVRRGVHLPKVVRNGLVVALGAFERLEREPALRLVRYCALGPPFFEDGRVVGRRRDDRHSRVVLRCSAEKSNTANVDLFDGGGECTVGLAGLENEGVQVADDEGNGGDGVGG